MHGQRKWELCLLLGILVTGGCGGHAAKPTAATTTHSACLRAQGHQEIAGELVDIPAKLPAAPPLVLVFHGLHESASYLAGETDFDDIAAQKGFVVAYPNATSAQRWQLNHHDGDDDVRHIGRFVDAVVKRVCADPARVYLTGFSNGGGFAYRAGCELAGKVAAIAPVSGSYRTHDPCSSAKRMPTLEIHGRDPWTGTVPRLLAAMTKRNHCRERPRTHHPSPGITRTIWPGCDLQRIYNRTIGHEWPKLGPYNTGVEVWDFVSRYPRR